MVRQLVACFGLFVALNGCGRRSVATAPPPNQKETAAVVGVAATDRPQRAAAGGSSATTLATEPSYAPSQAWGAAAGSSANVSSAMNAKSTHHLPPSWPHRAVEVTGLHGMVVTDNAPATAVGREVLASGGNAVDAAVAVAFALAVAYPTAGNLGGGGFAVTLTNGEMRALDFREVAPAAARPDMFIGSDGTPINSGEGILSVAVPGSVAGLWELHRSLGSQKKRWAELVAPAIALAERGILVDADFASGLNHVAERLRKSPASRALFFRGGKPLVRGSRWKNPDLARVLRRIAEHGADGFYRGPTAQALLAQMERDHGLITRTDLERYTPKWRQPLQFTYRGAKLTTMPPPSSGGITLAMMCHILEGYDLRATGYQTPETLHLVFEAMRRAYAARNSRLGDPDHSALPVEELLSKRWADAQRATILPDRATPSGDIASSGPGSGNGPHTTHFSVADAEGNAVALTTTINWWYGSGITVEGAGFVLNNEMDDFAAVPGTPNAYGLVQGEANAIAPGKRMLSSMSPTIVTDADGRIILVLGAAGGPTIITAVFQEISNAVDFGASFGFAVSAPRYHMQHLPDTVAFERFGLPAATQQRLESMGYHFTERAHIADAPLIGRRGEEWIGVAEPRRRGALAAAP